ncbi:MAG: YbaN family protein [Kangiellaceae bacterium]|nr:YbaN family protein [Kangiellaceae bacterium]
MSKLLYLMLGWLSVVLGIIGIILPVLPTTPFIILAAFLFGKGSPKARKWLIEHAHFGPIIEHWEREGAIAPKIKVFSCTLMLAVLVLSWYFGVSNLVLMIQALCLIPAALFVLTRPN